jgi:hypothetical protein
MTSRFLRTTLPALLLTLVLLPSGQSDAREFRRTRVYLPSIGDQSWGDGVILPRERHVLEKRPSGGTFLMNGTWYQAMAGHCGHWVAGDRIRLRAGSWYYGRQGFSGVGPILVRNMRRGRTCEFW